MAEGEACDRMRAAISDEPVIMVEQDELQTAVDELRDVADQAEGDAGALAAEFIRIYEAAPSAEQGQESVDLFSDETDALEDFADLCGR